MEASWDMLRAAIVLGVLIAGSAFSYRKVAQRTDRPLNALVRTVGTLFGTYLIVLHVRPMVAAGGERALLGLMLMLVVGIGFAAMWVPQILALITRPIQSLWLGESMGNPTEPFYASARGRRKRREFEKAIEEIDLQLNRFRGDLEGSMLKAEIQAQDLCDLDAAAETLREWLGDSTDKAPPDIAQAFNQLADWHIQVSLDPEAAGGALQQIIDACPETGEAENARQRIARLPTREFLEKNAATLVRQRREKQAGEAPAEQPPQSGAEPLEPENDRPNRMRVNPKPPAAGQKKTGGRTGLRSRN